MLTHIYIAFFVAADTILISGFRVKLPLRLYLCEDMFMRYRRDEIRPMTMPMPQGHFNTY